MTLPKALSLTRRPPASLPLGETVWKPTRQVRFRGPVTACSGHLRKGVVYHVRGGKTFVRPYVRPADPATERQKEKRSHLGVVQRSWSALPADVRKGWDDYARRHLFPERRQERGSGPGQNAHLRAQLYRLGWGGDLLQRPAGAAPPPAVLSVEEMAAPEGMFAFRVRHGLGSVAGHRLLFELTPATPSLRRKPRERELVWAGEGAADSFFPLGADGTVYLLERPRFEIKPGQRYGVRVRLLTEEGIPGPALTADLIRQEAAEKTVDEASGGSAPGDQGFRTLTRTRQLRFPNRVRLRVRAGVREHPLRL